MRQKRSNLWGRIPNGVWLLISLAVAVALWLFAAHQWPAVFATPSMVWKALLSKASNGVLWGHVGASLSRSEERRVGKECM